MRKIQIEGLVFAIVSFFGLCPPADAADCLRWVKREDVGSYGQRTHHAMAYDSDHGVTFFLEAK